MIMTVREIGSDQDSRLSPAPSGLKEPESRLVIPESYDGENPVILPIAGIHEQEIVAGGAKTVAKLPRTGGVMYITDSRVVVAIEKFEKGNLYLGFSSPTEGIAVLASGVSALRAARRRKGKVLVGQVRYQWLKFAGADPRISIGSGGGIYLGCEVKGAAGTRLYRLVVTLARGQVDPLDIIQDIIQRAARYRLAHFPGNPDHHARLDELAKVPRLPNPKPKELASYAMPNYFYVASANAYPNAPSVSDPDT
jgi:hypothetical protein